MPIVLVPLMNPIVAKLGAASKYPHACGLGRDKRRRRGDRISVDYATGARTAGTVSAICLEHRAFRYCRRGGEAIAWPDLDSVDAHLSAASHCTTIA